MLTGRVSVVKENTKIGDEGQFSEEIVIKGEAEEKGYTIVSYEVHSICALCNKGFYRWVLPEDIHNIPMSPSLCKRSDCVSSDGHDSQDNLQSTQSVTELIQCPIIGYGMSTSSIGTSSIALVKDHKGNLQSFNVEGVSVDDSLFIHGSVPYLELTNHGDMEAPYHAIRLLGRLIAT
jgi:hypothetical protein